MQRISSTSSGGGIKELIARFNSGSFSTSPTEQQRRRTSTISSLGSATTTIGGMRATQGGVAASPGVLGSIALGRAGMVVKTVSLVGVSLNWFLNFLRSDSRVVDVMKEEEATMEDIVGVVAEMTAEKDDVSIGEMLRRSDPTMIKDVADVFISYARKYLVVDMIGCLESLLEGEKTKGKEDVFIWFDLLCVNQRVHKKFDPDFFINALRKAIETISRVVVIACPWDNPANLTRSWCLWELYCATLKENTEVEIMIAPSQRNAFRQALQSDPISLFSRFGVIDVAKAQAFSKEDQKTILSVARIAKGGIEAVQKSLMGLFRKWMTREAMTLIDEKKEQGCSIKELVLLCNNIGAQFGNQGVLDVQEQYNRKVIDLEKQWLGDEHPNVVTSLGNLAELLDSQGKHDEAEALYRESLAINKKAFGEDHPRVATDLNNLAYLLRAQGKYEEAELLFRETLIILKKSFGDDHANVAIILNNLAALLDDQGKKEEAEEMYREAIIIKKKILGNEDPDVATSLNNLAYLLKTQGKHEEAEPLYREALAIWKKTLGEEHPDVAQSLSNLAELLRERGKYEESELLHRKALAIKKKAYGDDHPKVIASSNNLAILLQVQGKYKEAEPFYRDTLATRKKTLGNEHPKVATGLNNLGISLQAQGKYEEAEQSYREALTISRKALGDDHPDVVSILNNLRNLLKIQGKRKEAEELR